MSEVRVEDWETPDPTDSDLRAPAAGPPIPAAPGLGAGTIVGGRYRVERTLGRGGFGVVYEAEHVELGRRVALKVLKPELTASAEMIQRFQQEARTAAAIGHPNIVEVFDLGLDTAGAFIAMELLEGEELAKRIAHSHPLSEAFVARVGAEIADAMSVAHERGVVHRDLKPQNVFLITKGRTKDQVKVIDFGIAKLLRRVDGELTKTGQLFGTPSYMAPEQLRGVKTVDARVDVYACGAILYEALTGVIPYEAETYAELVLKVMVDPPAPIEWRRPDVTPRMREIVMRALAKDANERFQSARELADALFEHAAHAPTTVPTSLPVPPPAAPVAEDRVRALLAGSSGVREVAKSPPPRRRLVPFALAALALTGIGAATFVAVLASEQTSHSVPARPPTNEIAAIQPPPPALPAEPAPPPPVAPAEPAAAVREDYAGILGAREGDAVRVRGAVYHVASDSRSMLVLHRDGCDREACPVWVELADDLTSPRAGDGVALSGSSIGHRAYAARSGQREVPAVRATELRRAPEIQLGTVPWEVQVRAPEREREREQPPRPVPLPPVQSAPAPPSNPQPSLPRPPQMYEDEI